jgi:hypothetical protein
MIIAGCAKRPTTGAKTGRENRARKPGAKTGRGGPPVLRTPRTENPSFGYSRQ